MPYCPRCRETFAGDLTSCPKCNYDFENNSNETQGEGWQLIARIYDKTSADFAKETLESYNIPTVVISESGYFGQVGLNLPSISGKGMGKFQIHVPLESIEEAEDILNMILGDDWEKAN